jgi:hypothetical protein
MTYLATTIPDSKLANDVTQFIRDTESDLLFLHSSRVFLWGAWNAIALHTTPGIPEHMHPEIFLVQAGAGMDVAGAATKNSPPNSVTRS